MENRSKKSFVCLIFKLTYKLGQGQLEIANKKWLTVCTGAMLVLSLLMALKDIRICLLFFSMFYFGLFIGLSKDIFLSLRGFLLSGMLYWFCITGLVLYNIWNIIGRSVIIMYPLLMISWCIYSLIANNKVATVANQVHSTILGLIVIMKDMILYALPASYLNRVTPAGDTYEKAIEVSFGTIFSPLLAINLIALLLCTLKGYWIDKYNNGKDLELPEEKQAAANTKN